MKSDTYNRARRETEALLSLLDKHSSTSNYSKQNQASTVNIALAEAIRLLNKVLVD